MPLKILLVDDASTDETMRRAREIRLTAIDLELSMLGWKKRSPSLGRRKLLEAERRRLTELLRQESLFVERA